MKIFILFFSLLPSIFFAVSLFYSFTIINILLIPISYLGSSLLFMNVLGGSNSSKVDMNLKISSIVISMIILIVCYYSFKNQNYYFLIPPILLFIPGLSGLKSKKTTIQESLLLLTSMKNLFETGDYDNVIKYGNSLSGIQYSVLNNDERIQYHVLLGGAYQESGNLKLADENYDKYLKLIRISEGDLPKDWDGSLSSYKLFILIGHLKELGVNYKIETPNR